MELKLRNLKGTKDYLPEEQYIRNKIRKTLENTFEKYGYLPLETPILNYYDVMASKYAGGAEILKEVYKLSDQGGREIALRYDLTVPFAKVVGMNPNLRLPFKRYEIGKVFRDGPVKTGRNREFTQCDVDMVGVKSVMAEAEYIAMAVEVFDKLGLDVYVSYNNRKLLSGIIMSADVEETRVNDVILSLDKIEKIGEDGVCQELIEKGIDDEVIDNLLSILKLGTDNPLKYFKNNCSNEAMAEGVKELEELGAYLDAMGITSKTRLNPFLARGLDIYTGTVFEIFLSDGSITSSLGGGGRYDRIIGGFLNNGIEYPAVGISFGLDVIYTAMSMQNKENFKSPIDFYLIPMGTEIETMKLAQKLRTNGFYVDVEMTGRKLRKSLDYANKERIPYVIIMGEEEIKAQTVKLKNMGSGEEETIAVEELIDYLKSKI
ncbi:histidine--tRNA ligase [Lutispora thermophila]|uniref:Histidine--tRNA ligase n=1 Tax=Lutispora thermophila DSM 19022 TaxID=1122184 RepID=A0A1M6E6M2_9FIRM|nr:histidine--tRNA ligase [Lutispora thermophila]SHI81147.1 histidyl-tRNA synthetase [Lutispora thermophila DSM 19022]